MAFFAQKNRWGNGRFFQKSHGLAPLQNVDIFDFFRTSLFRSKKLYILSRISKNLYFWLFWLKKSMKKRSIFWQKPWTNLFAKCPLFSTLWELHFWGVKNFIFNPEYKKNVSYLVFARKKIYKKKFDFLTKTMDQPLCKMSILFTLLKLHFSGLKSILYYPKYKKNVSFWLSLLKRTH